MDLKIDKEAPTISKIEEKIILNNSNYKYLGKKVTFDLSDNASGLNKYQVMDSSGSILLENNNINVLTKNFYYTFENSGKIKVVDNAGNEKIENISVNSLSYYYSCTGIGKVGGRLLSCSDPTFTSNLKLHIITNKQLTGTINDYGTARRVPNNPQRTNNGDEYVIYLNSKKHGTGYNYYYVKMNLYLDGEYIQIEDKTSGNSFVG